MTYRVAGLFELERAYNAMAKATAKAEARAVGRVSTTIVNNQSRAVVQRLNLKVSRVKEAVRIAVKPTAEQPRVVIEIKRRPVGLIEYGGQWRGRKSEGASAIVLKGSGRSTLGGTFIAAGLKSNRQIFERTGKFKVASQGRYAGERRETLKAFYGPSVFSQFRREDIIEVGRKTWEERLPVELQREIAFALKQAGLS